MKGGDPYFESRIALSTYVLASPGQLDSGPVNNDPRC